MYPYLTFFYSILDNLRGLLSHQATQQYPPMGNFGPGGMGGMDGRGMTSQQQAAAMQQMQRSYMNSQAGHYGPGGAGGSGNNQNGQIPTNANVMNSAAAMQRYQQMQNSRQMLNQMRNAPQNMMGGSNMKNNTMRFSHGGNPSAVVAAAAAANFNPSSAAQQLAQQMQQSSGGGGGAKWHTPQQKQATNHSNNLSAMMGMSMSPPANNFINDSFKIPLRSPDTLRNNQNNQSSSTSNGQNASSFPIPLPNVTSSAPKTPSPSQKDPQKEIDSIDMVCNESVVDLLATIAKLDSNGVQVVPEGRNKATSPQVHSSTSDSLDPNSINLNDKSLNQSKDDPNEDWCAVCMGKFVI